MAALEMQLMNADQYRFLADGEQKAFETRKVWVDGKPTDEDAVDEQGRKSFYVNVLARRNGERLPEVTRVVVHKQPKPLKDLQELKLVGPISVAVRGTSRQGSTFVELHYALSAEEVAE